MEAYHLNSLAALKVDSLFPIKTWADLLVTDNPVVVGSGVCCVSWVWREQGLKIAMLVVIRIRLKLARLRLQELRAVQTVG